MMAHRIDNLLAHWSTLLENVCVSPLAVYDQIEDAITSQDIPNISISRVEYKEGNLFSARRTYLRVKRKTLIFDICAAPQGSNFVLAWWLGETAHGITDLFIEVPLFGAMLESLARPATRYQIDITSAFQHAIHNSVLEVAKKLAETHGLEPLSIEEQTPILSDFYNW